MRKKARRTIRGYTERTTSCASLAVVLGGVLSPFRGSLRATGVKLSPPRDQSEIGAVGPFGGESKSKNESRKKHSANEESGRGRGRRGDEKLKRKRRPWKSGRGKESEQRDGIEEKMRSIGNSPQSQPGHVDLPIPRWV